MKIETYGMQGGPSILCVPGIFMIGECFSQLAHELPDCHFVCVTLDAHHPGSGEFVGLTEEVDAIVGALQQKGLTEFDMVMGLSLGTVLALELARRPELHIGKLFLDGAINLHHSKYPRLEKGAMLAVFWHCLHQGKKKKESIRMSSMTYEGNWGKMMQQTMAYMTPSSLETIASVLSDYTLQPGIAQPMYFLYGAKESFLKANCEIIHAHYPEASIEIMDGHDHLTYLTHNLAAYAMLVMAVLAGKSQAHSDDEIA